MPAVASVAVLGLAGLLALQFGRAPADDQDVALGRATAPQNVEGERVGAINRAYSGFKRVGNAVGGVIRQFKRKNPKAYRILRPVAAAAIAVLLYRWIV